MIFPSLKLMRQAAFVIARQQERIEQLEQEVMEAELAYMRISRDIIEQFLITMDIPEEQDEIRKRLMTSLEIYRDEIAVREEHA